MSRLIVSLLLVAFATPAFNHVKGQDSENNLEITDGKDSIGNESVKTNWDLDLDILDSSYFDEDEIVPPPSKATNHDTEEPLEIVEQIIVPSKGPCLGCPQTVNTESKKIQDLAHLAFGHYLAQGNGLKDEPMEILLRVTKAEQQVVAGIKYMMEVELGRSTCSKAEFGSNPEGCVLDTTKPTTTCDFHVIEKSWAEIKQEVVRAECHKDEPLEVSTPIVEDNFEARDVVTSVLGDEEVTKKRRKREAKYGEIKESTESPEVILEIAKFAIQKLDEVDDDNFARVVVDVLKSSKQTVSGWLYHLKIRVAQTSCAENSGATLETCQEKITLPFERCEVKVLFQPWQTVQRKLVHSQCTREDYKKSKKIAKQLFSKLDKELRRRLVSTAEQGPITGGKIVLDPEKADIADLTEFAINSMDSMSNALHAQKLVRVVYAERQLVSGVSTTLVIELGYTKCRKSPKLDKSLCLMDEDRAHQYCNVTIFEKPWLQQKNVTGFQCGSRQDVMVSSSRSKRETNPLDDSDEIEELEADELEFGHFQDTYGKEYTAEEYGKRLAIFKKNMDKVRLLQKTEQGTAVYGTTEFADLTEDEFNDRHLGLRLDLKQRSKRKMAKIPPIINLPNEFDWRHYNVVTPVKNQKLCGSCWAFSVTGNIEGLYALKHRELLSFSEQELVDCDNLDQGCRGGLPENAYKALEKLGGLETEEAYPYDGKDETCHFNSSVATAKVTGFTEVSKNETEMAAWILKNGPVSIGINANAMQFYFGGVSHPWKFLCSPKSLDHGVLIVGFGIHSKRKDIPYWIVKNSWGTRWGEEGYYRIYRGDGSCGVNQMVTSAFLA